MQYVMYGKGIVGSAIVKLLNYLKIDCVYMDDADRDDAVLQKADKIILTAGISPKSDVYKQYKNKLIGELDLCYGILKDHDLLDKVRFYCITGTNGKSTTTWLWYNVLKKLEKKLHGKVRICGNFEPAVSEVVLEILQSKDESSYHLVTEISSFMCHYIQNFQSDYSIITNLAPDHLNRHEDLDEYWQAKLKLFEHTKYACITEQGVADYIKQKKLAIPHLIIYTSTINPAKTNFIGDHNAANLSSVYEAIKAMNLGITQKAFYELLETVKPLPHRCQKGPLADGIQFIDDLHATGAHAQQAALSSVPGKLILVCGGFDKGDDYAGLLEKYRGKVAAGVIIGKSGKPFSDLFDQLGIEYMHTQDMKRGLEKAIELAKRHKLKTVLYSPGCASFDLFRNRAHRAEMFEKELRKIKKYSEKYQTRD